MCNDRCRRLDSKEEFLTFLICRRRKTSKMTIIDDELDEIRRCCENVIPDSKVVACVPAMIRVEIRYFLYDTCLSKINITIE